MATKHPLIVHTNKSAESIYVALAKFDLPFFEETGKGATELYNDFLEMESEMKIALSAFKKKVIEYSNNKLKQS